MYTNAAAVFRGDIAGVLEQAKDWETNLVGTRVMPVLPVPVRAGQYPSFLLKQGQLLKNEIKQRSPNSSYARATAAYNQETYLALEYGVEMGVDDTVAQDVSRFFDAEVVAAKLAQRKLLLGQRVRHCHRHSNHSRYSPGVCPRIRHCG